MLPSIIDLWQAGRGRRAALAAIGPLVDRSRERLNGIADIAWLDPYMIGFLVMLITLIARHKVGVLDSDALGIVQREAWAEITGLKAELIGEEVFHLSANSHKEFEAGCRNAIVFHETLSRISSVGEEPLPDFSMAVANATSPFRALDDGEAAIAESASIASLWHQYFDEHIPPRREDVGGEGIG